MADEETKAAFGIYPKQRAAPSSKETKEGMAEAAKFAADMVIPQTPFDAGLMLIPAGGLARKAGAALIALDAGNAEAGGLSSLMKLLAKEAPAQAKAIREALGKAYTKDLEHSVVGSSDKGPAGSIMSGTWDEVSPNQLDIQRALRSDKPIIDFHTHPQGAQAAFDIAPSEGDFRFYSNEYFPGSKGRELRTIVASPAANKTPTSYSFFATDNPSNVFDRRTMNNAVYELQRAGSKGTFKSVIDDPRFREYFDAGGTLGELAENIAPLSLLDLRKAQNLGRGELKLSGRKLSQNQGSSNVDLFNLMNPPAVEFLTRKGFADGGEVDTTAGGYVDYDPAQVDAIMQRTSAGFAEGGEVEAEPEPERKPGDELAYAPSRDELEMLRRFNFTSGGGSSVGGVKQFGGRLGYTHPIDEDTLLRMGVTGHYASGPGWRNSAFDRGDIEVEHRLDRDSSVRAKLNAGRRGTGLNQVNVTYNRRFADGGTVDIGNATPEYDSDRISSIVAMLHKELNNGQ